MQRHQAPFRADIVGSFYVRTPSNRLANSWLQALLTRSSYGR